MKETIYFFSIIVVVVFSVVGNYILHDFGLIIYAPNGSKIGEIKSKISHYKFKEEGKSIYLGAEIYQDLNYESWKLRCQNLLHKFYTRDGQCSGIITFPETDITAQGKPSENVMRTLKKWCENSNSASGKGNEDDATGIIIRNYDLKDHLDFCKVTDNEKKDCLPLLFNNFETIFKLHENDQRFLVFNPSEKILLIIRMVDAQQSGELKNETYLCIDEVNLVCFLLKDELKGSGVIVAGLVTYSGENSHSQICTRCGNFIVTNKIFNSVDQFEVFWKRFLKENISKFEDSLNARVNIDTTDVFQAVGSKILGYLAHLQFTPGTLEEPVLPITKNTPSGNIKQAELLLDRYQMKIAYSDEKRILLHGNYGTGKTVVALKKLDLLQKCLKEKEVIYYVNFATKSRLDCMIKQKFKTNDKVRLLRGSSSLSRIVTDDILPKEMLNDTENIHLIVDEYNSQDLSPDESANLYQIFTEAEQFKNSTLLIALQPIKIDRVDHVYVAGKMVKNLHKKHVFEPLKTILTEYELKYVMRTTIEINTLVEITQNFLSKKRNQYVHPHQFGKIISSLSEMEELKSEISPGDPKTLTRLPQNSSPNAKPFSNITSRNSCDLSNSGLEILPIDFTESLGDEELKYEAINFDFLFHNSAPVVSSSSSIASVVSPTPGNSSNPAADNMSFQSQESTDLSTLYELTSKTIDCMFTSRNLSFERGSPGNIFLCDSSNPGKEIVPTGLQEIKDGYKLMSGEINHEFSSPKLAPVVSFSSSISSVASSSYGTSQFPSSPIIDFDESYKLTSTSSQIGEKDLSKTVTTYSYTCDSKIGHNINGPLPLLIEFKKSYRPKKLMELIAFFLKKVIHIESKRIAILHFESANAPWLQQLLKLKSYFKKLTLTDDAGKFLANTTENMVLVNSYDIVKGLEFSEVLLILEKDEEHRKQYIPEAITRCESNLSVLIRPAWKKNKPSKAVQHLVKHWKKINDAKYSKEGKSLVKLVTLGHCLDERCKLLNENRNELTFCPDSHENPSFYGVHTHTKLYKSLSNEINNKIVPNLHLDDKSRVEEAAAL